MAGSKDAILHRTRPGEEVHPCLWPLSGLGLYDPDLRDSEHHVGHYSHGYVSIRRLRPPRFIACSDRIRIGAQCFAKYGHKIRGSLDRCCCQQGNRYQPEAHFVQIGPGQKVHILSLIHISEPTRLGMISYAVFCLKKKKKKTQTMKRRGSSRNNKNNNEKTQKNM